MSKVPNAPPLILYVIYQALSFAAFAVLLLPVVLFRSILHLHPSSRPYPTWSYRRSVAVAVGRLYLACTTFFCLPRAPGKEAWKEHALVRGQAGDGTAVKAVSVPPVRDDWRVGIARAAEGLVEPVDVPCFWTYIPAQNGKEGDARAGEGERVVLYVAGGSWVMGHPQSTPFPYKTCTESGHRVLAVNHRKAVEPSSAFPAQLLDLLAGYAYLLSLGFLPENITFLGDSSGGHLVLALSRYLAELDEAVPDLNVGMPGALMLISPSCDLSHAPHPFSATDFLVPFLNQRAYPSLARHFPHAALENSPYFSPALGAPGAFAYLAAQGAQADGQKVREREGAAADRNQNADEKTHETTHARGGACRVWLQYGSVENLRPDIERLVARMRADGVALDVDVVPGGVHLDAGLAYALHERGEGSSWVRFVQAVRTYA